MRHVLCVSHTLAARILSSLQLQWFCFVGVRKLKNQNRSPDDREIKWWFSEKAVTHSFRREEPNAMEGMQYARRSCRTVNYTLCHANRRDSEGRVVHTQTHWHTRKCEGHKSAGWRTGKTSDSSSLSLCHAVLHYAGIASGPTSWRQLRQQCRNEDVETRTTEMSSSQVLLLVLSCPESDASTHSLRLLLIINGRELQPLL